MVVKIKKVLAFLAYLFMRSSALETSAARWWTCLLRAWYSSALAAIHLCGIMLRVAGCENKSETLIQIMKKD